MSTSRSIGKVVVTAGLGFYLLWLVGGAAWHWLEAQGIMAIGRDRQAQLALLDRELALTRGRARPVGPSAEGLGIAAAQARPGPSFVAAADARPARPAALR